MELRLAEVRKDNIFYKNLLNFYLNVKINPKVDWSFILGKYPYLGYSRLQDVVPKIAVFDVDHIFEKEDSDELSKVFLYNIAKENQNIANRMSEIVKYVKILQTPDGMIIGENELSKIFRECNLKENEYNDAGEESAKEFIKNNLIEGAVPCIEKLRYEMGYLSVLLSASPDICLEHLGRHLGIDKDNIIGTHFPFYNGRLKGNIEFQVGKRRLAGKDVLLKQRINTKYGCYFIFDDNPDLNAPTMKSGLNPSILVGNFTHEQISKFNLDIFTCCPEARKNLLSIIAPMNRFEYGWIVANVMPKEAIIKTFRLSYNQRKLFDKLEVMDVERQEYSHLRDKFVSLSVQILNFKNEFRLSTEDSEIRDDLWGLLATKRDAKNQIKNIFEFFKTNIPETEVLESQLYEMRNEFNL